MPEDEVQQNKRDVTQHEQSQVGWCQAFVQQKQRGEMVQSAMRQAQEDHADDERPELPLQRETRKQQHKDTNPEQCQISGNGQLRPERVSRGAA